MAIQEIKMRNKVQLLKINTVRKESKRSCKILILEDKESRQFFRYDHGQLVEYDLTKFNGKPVRLTSEETAAAKAIL